MAVSSLVFADVRQYVGDGKNKEGGAGVVRCSRGISEACNRLWYIAGQKGAKHSETLVTRFGGRTRDSG